MIKFLKRLYSSHVVTSDAVTMTPDTTKPAKSGPWIGVDLDGTLAHYDHWRGEKHIGKPVPTMLARVQNWRAQGFRVKIFTARASVPELVPPIQRWLSKHDLDDLEITNCKDMQMIELWDDRSVQVIANTGSPVRSTSFRSQPRVPLMAESAQDIGAAI